MKAKNAIMTAIPIVLCLLLLLVPILELVGLCKGLEFSLNNELALVIVQAVLAVGALVAFLVIKPEPNLACRISLLLAAPIAVANALCFVDSESIASLIIALICGGCVFTIYLRFLPDSNLKAASAVISVLLTILLAVLFVWGLIYGSVIKQKTVHEEIASPNGEYIAVVCSEKSLFGTDTVIYIRKAEPEGKALFGSYRVPDMLVYEGEDHEVKSAVLSWLDDETLIINDRAYAVIKTARE